MKNTTQTITTIESSSKFQEPTFWFDMDGVIAKYNLSDYEGDNPKWLSERNYFATRPVDHKAVAVLNALAEEHDCHIISKIGLGLNSSISYDEVHFQAKNVWLSKYLPREHFPMTKRHFVSSHVSKAAVARLILKRPLTHTDVLVDDNNTNLEDWKRAGGAAYKYGNGINDISSWDGASSTEAMSKRQIVQELIFLAALPY